MLLACERVVFASLQKALTGLLKHGVDYELPHRRWLSAKRAFARSSSIPLVLKAKLAKAMSAKQHNWLLQDISTDGAREVICKIGLHGGHCSFEPFIAQLGHKGVLCLPSHIRLPMGDMSSDWLQYSLRVYITE